MMQVMRALGSDGGTSLQALADVLTSCTPYHPHSHLRPRPPADISPWQIPAARPPTAAIPSPSPPAPNAAAAAAAAAESAAAARAQQRRSAAVRHSGAMNNGLDESAGRLLFSSSGSGAAATSSSGWRWQWDADGSDEGLTAAEVGLFSSSASAGARINTDAIVGKVVCAFSACFIFHLLFHSSWICTYHNGMITSSVIVDSTWFLSTSVPPTHRQSSSVCHTRFLIAPCHSRWDRFSRRSEVQL